MAVAAISPKSTKTIFEGSRRLPCVIALITVSRTAMLVQCSVSSSSPAQPGRARRPAADRPARRPCSAARGAHVRRARPCVWPKYSLSMASATAEVNPARRVRGRCGSPGTNPFLIGTRCWPRWPTAHRRSRRTPRAPTARRRSNACGTSGWT